MDKNKTEIVRDWVKKESQAEQFRDQVCERNGWKDYIDEMKGNFRKLEGISDIIVQPLNFVFAYVKTEIPALYLRDPHLKVNPKKKSSIQSAKILEEALNYIWRDKKIKRENKKNITDGKLIGHSWFKQGYTGTFGTVEDGKGGTIQTIESEDFFGYRVPWDCITFDTESIDPPYDCRWICHTTYVPLEEVKSNPRYKNTEKINPMTPKRKYNSSTESRDKDNDGDYKMACLKEFWDKKGQTVFTLSPGVDDYIESPKPWPYEMKGWPFKYLNFKIGRAHV